MTRAKNLLPGLFLALLVLGVGSSLTAQGFLGVSFGKHGKHGHVGVSVGIPLGGSHCAPVHRHSDCCKRWIPGHFEVVTEQVFVPGCCRQVWVEPVYATEYDHCGRPFQVLVAPGHYETVQEPGHYETVQRQIWVAPTFVLACGF